MSGLFGGAPLRCMVISIGFMAALPHGTTKADPLYAPAGPNLGGGFIEFLMTGQTPTHRQGAPSYAAPPPPSYYRTVPARRGYVQQQAGLATQLDDDPLALPGPAGRGLRRERTPAPVQSAFDPKFEKQEVAYAGPHGVGTVVIDTPSKFLYLVLGNGRALRYGIGVGRPGFEWAGVKSVTMKREWPDWRPPAEMLKRRPDLPRHMAGGPENPLGARALYLGSSLYRIHGTNEPETIGRAVSSGCIRMRNEDVVDLYEKVRVGAKVVVI